MAYKQKGYSAFTSIPEKKISKQKGHWDYDTMYGTQKGGKDRNIDYVGRSWTNEESIESRDASKSRNQMKNIDATLDKAFNRPKKQRFYEAISSPSKPPKIKPYKAGRSTRR